MADTSPHSNSSSTKNMSSTPVNRLSCTVRSSDKAQNPGEVHRPSSLHGHIQDRPRSETQRKLRELLTTECLLSMLPCSGCGCEVARLHEHPLFDDIGTCVRCLEYLDPDGSMLTQKVKAAASEGQWQRKLIDTGWERDDDQKEIYCRLCGEGGEILQCEDCVKAICRLCLTRWLGEEHWRHLTESDDKWYCPDCQEEEGVAGGREAPLLRLIREKQLEALVAYLTLKALPVKAAIEEADATVHEVHPTMPPRQHSEWPVWLRNGGSVEVFAARQWRDATVIEVFPETCYCRYRKAHGLWNEEIPADRIRRPGAAASVKDEGDVLLDGRSISVCLPERPVKELTKLTIKEDITKGRERIPIPLVVDQVFLDETEEEALSRVVMPQFTYIDSTVAGRSLLGSVIPIRSVGACVGCRGDRCHREPSAKEKELRDIEWSKRSQVTVGGDSDCGKTSLCSWGAYNRKGYLKATMDCVVECNFLCACDYNTCPLRVVQKGITKCLEVFWTGPDRGWGVRCLEPIEAGAFICEYAGELLSEAVTEVRGQKYSDGYFFDLSRYGVGQTWNVGAGGARLSRNEASSMDAEQYRQSTEGDCMIAAPPAGPPETTDRNSEFTLDAHFLGNVGRFINHSCSPNLARQLVLVDTHDYRLPRIAFFAEKDIEPGEELVYDYGYRVGLVAGKTMKCECGSVNCKKILY